MVQLALANDNYQRKTNIVVYQPRKKGVRFNQKEKRKKGVREWNTSAVDVEIYYLFIHVIFIFQYMEINNHIH